MKKYVWILLAGLATIFQSCNDDDGYSVGDMGIDWVTVHVEGDGLYTYTGDTWGTMWPAASGIFGRKLVEGQRAILYFNPLADDFSGYDVAIKPEAIQPFLTKSVETLTSANASDYSNDPTYVEDIWIASNYLHVYFLQKLPAEKLHRVSLVHDEALPEVGDDGYIHLEYRYNTYGDTLNVANEGLVCFNLNTLPLAQAKGIKLKVNDARKGEQELTFEKDEETTQPDVSRLVEADARIE